MTITARLLSGRKLRRHLRDFRSDEQGSLIVFTLYVLICMLLAVGLSLDTARYEYTRAKLQATLDRAVLAAANLEQTLDPVAVVEDYFKKAGLSDHLISVSVEQGFNHKTVSATSQAEIPTMFIDMVGINSLAVPASGAANESLADIEIAMVLDNSGSMGQNGNERMNLLKPAARDFIDAVAREEGDTDGTTTISIIPFATQVNAGATLLDEYNVTNEHSYSNCVTFGSSDFTTPVLSQAAQLQRTMHMDGYYSNWYLSDIVCNTSSTREITPWSTDAEYLKSRINAMSAEGWTSIEIGTKWGLTMLDPSTRPVLNSLVAKGVVAEGVKDQPFDYDRDETRKVLIVMSDGENTRQWDIKAPYREGNSPLYHYRSSGTDYYSYHVDRSGTTYDYYSQYHGNWRTSPVGGSSAEQMTWPEVWADMSVKRFTQSIMSPATGTYWSTLYDRIADDIATSTKNARTSQICKAAKDQGILVFTIGMDTYGQGDATLSDCASLPTYFYDVRAIDISNAFASIALQINQLRLTQ